MIQHAIPRHTAQLCPFTDDEFLALDVLCSLSEREQLLAQTVWQAATLHAQVAAPTATPVPWPVFTLTPVKDGRVLDAMRDYREALHTTREDRVA